MSVLFSKVTITNDSGEYTEFFVSGMPQDGDDLSIYLPYQEFCEDIDDEESLTAEVESYTCGTGELENADDDFLFNLYETDFVDFTTQPDVDFLRCYSFEI